MTRNTLLAEQAVGSTVSYHPILSHWHAGLPELRIIRTRDLLLHEELDRSRTSRLTHRIAEDGVLRNPPIVARMEGSSRYMLLDGANRLASLECLGVPDILVQVEPYEEPGLGLSHWNHVVLDIEAQVILERARRIPGVLVIEGRDIEEVTGEPYHLCTMAFGDGSLYHLYFVGYLKERVKSLRAISDIYYQESARVIRITHFDVEFLRQRLTGFGAAILYTDFTKAQVRGIAESGNRLSSGLTRFIVPRRVLGFNCPIAVLKASRPLAQKQYWLEETLHKKWGESKVHPYQEPTCVFDD